MNDRVAVRSDASGEATREKPRMRVGIVGWRGMVGSVLMRRMLEENDFALIEPEFFTTSNVGGEGPAIGRPVTRGGSFTFAQSSATASLVVVSLTSSVISA